MTDDKKSDRDDEDDAPPEPHEGEKHSFTAKLLGDLAKRALTTGIGAVFMSEETLRSQLSEMKLPKEAMGYVVSQADKTKRELVEVIARETRAFFARLEVEDMIGRALTGTTIEITTRVRILPKEGGGVALAVEKNDSALVPTAAAAGTAPRAPGDEDKPRRKRRRKDDDGEEG
jgi:hypothetical protein